MLTEQRYSKKVFELLFYDQQLEDDDRHLDQ